MSPKAKNKSFPPVKVTEEFLEETQKIADSIGKHGIFLSEYIRQAVEEKNERIMAQPCNKCNGQLDEDCNYIGVRCDSTHKNNTVSESGKDINVVTKSTMVKPLVKGGGKK